MTALLEQRISLQDEKSMAALIIVDYYELIKELSTALALLDGWKTTSHKELMQFVKKEYCADPLLDDLRVLRNRIAYEGFHIDTDFLRRNKKHFIKIKLILRRIIEERLQE
jgi:hypothetical protein